MKLAVVIGLVLVLNIAFCDAAKKAKMAAKSGKMAAKMEKESMTSSSQEEDPEDIMEDPIVEVDDESMLNVTSKEDVEEEPGLSSAKLEEEPGLSSAADEEDAEDVVEEMEEEGSSKKSVKNFTCQVTGALLAMAESIKELSNDIKSIEKHMFEKCPGFVSNDTGLEDSLEDGAMNDTDSATEVEEDVMDGGTDHGPTTTPLPPIPTECDPPFQPVASSCYYFLYYPSDWKTWGDANAYCQNLGGTLAAPYRLPDLREYLVENFSNVFWVGAKKTGKEPFKWLNGKEVDPEDWKEDQPSKTGARKNCVYLEYFSGYKAINHYCGEKFSFVCEERVDVDEED